MNLLFKKAAAVFAAGIMAAASLGAECYAEGAQLTRSYVELKMEATVAKPTYQVKGSLGKRRIALTTTTAGASIYYTTNGTTPTTKSRLYTGALIKLTSNTKIKAIAVKDGVSSKVMTKTFAVPTKYGDVTGDGNINQNDYTKFKNYLSGKTVYICKDNADCNGDGKVSSKDLTVLQQYLAGRILRLPSDPIATVKKPTATIRKIYGGKQVELACASAGATIYYTTDGTTPTNYSTKYTAPFTLDSTKTVNAIGYLDGEMSKLRTFSVSVGTLGSVTADKDTVTTYQGEVSVGLTCSTSGARILYTIDGSDPKTSSTAAVYSSPLKLNKNTTVKAFAQAKGYGDTQVYTYDYKVDESFTISGFVWDDTTGNGTSSNGLWSTTENGISGINVYLINASIAVKDASVLYTKKTTTDANGKYSFKDLVRGETYKVVFEYNYQRYRAYPVIVTGGNQAIPYTDISPVKVTYNGVYSSTNSGDTYLNSVLKYADAITSSYYTTYAATSSNYSQSTDDVNLALITKNYGILDLTVTVSGQDKDNTITNGKKLTYTFTLTNNSPMLSVNLSDAQIGIFLTDAFNQIIRGQRTTSISTNYTHTTDGYVYYLFSDFIGSSGLAPGKSASFTLEGTVDADNNTVIECYAQVNSYKFSTGCYDYYSVPGSLSTGGTKAERDEGVAAKVRVVGSTATTNKKLNVGTQSKTTVVGDYVDYDFYIINGTSVNDVYVSSLNTTVASYSVLPAQKYNDMLAVTIRVYGESVGSSSVTITLAEDTKQTYTFTTTVLSSANAAFIS